MPRMKRFHFDAVGFSQREGGSGRLPTEAEWEHARCAISTNVFGSSVTLAPLQANYDGRASRNRTTKGKT